MKSYFQNYILGLSLLFFSPISGVIAQTSIKNYVTNTTVQISTIDPGANDYSDLEVIGKAIGDAKIVMLGEQDHGDAPTFLAKTRIIKYLHEQKGFDVLAFESDFFALNEGWDTVQKTKAGIANFLKRNIYQVWSYCDACRDLLFNYLPNSYQTKNPIIITGFDNQLYLNFSFRNLVNKADSVLHALGLSITKEPLYKSSFLPALDSLTSARTDSNVYITNAISLQKIRAELKEKLPLNHFWMMVFENLARLNEKLHFSPTNRQQSEDIRDFQMAQNLRWLNEVKYADKKIIVWAANTHVAKIADSIKKHPERKNIRMGYYFTKDSIMLNKTYVLGFTSFNGDAGRLGGSKYAVAKPRSTSFERWIDPSYKYSFTNFKAFNKEHPGKAPRFYLKGLGHQNFITTWTKIYDGIFFIRNMYPCKGIEL